MKKKKIYKYGVLLYGDRTVLWDFLNNNLGSRLVYTYNVRKKIFTTTGRFTNSDYDYIINSFDISYKMFENSPEIAIELLKNEHNKDEENKKI